MRKLLAFFEVVIQKLDLDADRFKPGTIGEMWSKKTGTVKCQASFSSYFAKPPSLFTVKMIPKLMTVLVKNHLPGWEFISANIYNKSSPVGHYDIEDYMEKITPTLVGDELPADSELGVYLKAPAEYQVEKPKRRKAAKTP